jgi:hypothetical protein
MAFDGSYPAPPGNKHFSIIDVPISGAYTAITTGTPPTGGIALTAQTFGLTQIEWAQAIGSDNGQYDGVIYMNPFNLNQQSPAVRLQVITAATGAEASGTIAAGRTMRVLALGF